MSEMFKIVKDKKYKEAEKQWKYYIKIVKRCVPHSDEYNFNLKYLIEYRDLVMGYRKEQIKRYKERSNGND